MDESDRQPPPGPDDVDGIVDRAMRALRDAPVPDGPSPELRGLTLQKLGDAVPQPSTSRPNVKQRSQTMRSILKIAAVFVIALSAVALVVWATRQHAPAGQAQSPSFTRE